MKKMVKKNTTYPIWIAMLLFLAATACERSVDGLSQPDFPANPDVFINSFSAGMEYYPYEGSRAEAFSVDTETTFGNRGASMRFDVPNVGDPQGAFAGAIFRDDNGGRNMSSYNALTFYAKANQASTLANIGFGQDFFGDEFEVSLSELRLTTNWRKYIIPIPDPSLLTQHKGLLWYAAGPENGDGFSFWMDEVKYERLDDIAQSRPAILNGANISQTSLVGSSLQIVGLQYTANLPDGQDVTIGTAPSYFEFSSSNTNVATVSADGSVSVVGEGTAVITATLAGQDAAGSLTIDSSGEFILPPEPTIDPANVISIFSDAEGYEDIPVDFYNGFYAPFQTTTSNDFEREGQRFLGYENFNFVGIEFNQNVPTVDGSEMTHLTFDLFFPDEVPAGSAIRARIINDVGGAEQSASATITSDDGLVSREWIQLVVDIRDMEDRSQLGQIILDSDEGPALAGATFYATNIYFFRDE